MTDLATLLIIAVFTLGGWTLFAWGFHAGFKQGQESERDATAQRFVQFRLRRFNASED